MTDVQEPGPSEFEPIPEPEPPLREFYRIAKEDEENDVRPA